MAITVSWLDDTQTMLRYDVSGAWTWQDLAEALNQGNDLMDSVSHRVEVIVDMSGSAGMPANMIELGRRMTGIRRPENMGVVVVIQGGALLEALVGTMRRIYKGLDQSILYADTLEAARAAAVAARSDN